MTAGRWSSVIAAVLFHATPVVALDSASYLYDDNGRLEQIIHSDGTRVFFSYDAAGNTIARSAAAGPPPVDDADLAVRLWSEEATIDGGPFTMHAQIINHGPAPASDVSLVVDVPPTLSLLAHSPSIGTCAAGSGLECSVAALAAGASMQLTMTLEATSPAAANVTAEVSAAEWDPQPGNNAATRASPTIVNDPLSVFVELAQHPVRQGETVTYLLEITNHGEVAALDTRLEFQAASLHAVQSAASPSGSCTIATAVVCDLGTLAPGASTTASVDVLVDRPGDATVIAEVSATLSAAWPAIRTTSFTHAVEATGQPVVELAPGELDTGQFGNWGARNDLEGVIVMFESDASQDLEVGVVGHDIDYLDEVRVTINGVDAGFLSQGLNRKLNRGDVFNIPAAAQFPGVNIVHFEQARSASNTWGVTDLQLQPAGTINFADVVIEPGVVDPGQYGNKWTGVNYGHELIVSFLASGDDDVELHVTGFDIDSANEVRITVNAVELGHLTKGPNNGLNAGDTFVIPASMLGSSYTHVRFWNKKTSYIWGVTNLLVETAGP